MKSCLKTKVKVVGTDLNKTSLLSQGGEGVGSPKDNILPALLAIRCDLLKLEPNQPE